MKAILVALSLFVFSVPAAAQEAGCNSRASKVGMQNIETYFRADDLELFIVQLLLRESGRSQNLNPDGKWGPASGEALCQALYTYIVVGNEPVRSVADVKAFARWIATLSRAVTNPGRFDLPD